MYTYHRRGIQIWHIQGIEEAQCTFKAGIGCNHGDTRKLSYLQLGVPFSLGELNPDRKDMFGLLHTCEVIYLYYIGEACIVLIKRYNDHKLSKPYNNPCTSGTSTGTTALNELSSSKYTLAQLELNSILGPNMASSTAYRHNGSSSALPKTRNSSIPDHQGSQKLLSNIINFYHIANTLGIDCRMPSQATLLQIVLQPHSSTIGEVVLIYSALLFVTWTKRWADAQLQST